MNIPCAILAIKQSQENYISNQKILIEDKINEAIKTGEQSIVVRIVIDPTIGKELERLGYVVKEFSSGYHIISWRIN
jgi:hypothetical protein